MNFKTFIQSVLRRPIQSVSAVAVSTLLIAIPAIAQKATPETTDEVEVRDGQPLAQELRSARPLENSEIRGLLIIRSRGADQVEIPVLCRVVVENSTWKTIYRTSPTPARPAEALVVVHSATGPNEYLYARAASPSDPLPEPAPVPSHKASIPLAGSDFTLADLGLEFLHWPQQVQLKGELRLGRPCYVLESRNPNARDVVRIKSYIDKESNGLLVADGYDRENDRPTKVFSLSGSSFKKVNGQWRLEKMEIRDVKRDSRTILKFDVNQG